MDVPPQIYPPREDTALLVQFASVPRGKWLLEIGCGAGSAALEAAVAGARVVAADLNPFALRYLHNRARVAGLTILLVRTDLARGLRRFDRILANPPYLPTTPEVRDPDPWHNLAVDGGSDGCVVLERIVATLADHLAPGGEAYVLVSSRQDARHVAQILEGFAATSGATEAVRKLELPGETLTVWRFRRSSVGTRPSTQE